VTVTLHRGTRRVLIVVADNGPGVEAALLPHIFDRHVSFRDRNRSDAAGGGTSGNFGLGLWVAKRNMDSVGGTIEAANRRGGGFIVTLGLPLA
jgi:two-component system sensor histidine kinase ChvG